MSDMKLRICHLYPDLLNLYGDTGNIICMKKRLEWRGIGCEVIEASVGDRVDPADFDMFFIGGGQDFEQDVLLKDAEKNKKAAIVDAIESSKVGLAICGGYQILGKYYKTGAGKQLDFMGCIDIYTEGQEQRMIGNCMFTCDDMEGRTIIGFENHSGRTYLGEKVRPIGNVISGYGNNGEDGKEGAIYKNTYCTYSHGPLLPKNPEFCDMLLTKALEVRYGKDVTLEALDDAYENKAHKVMQSRLSK